MFCYAFDQIPILLTLTSNIVDESIFSLQFVFLTLTRMFDLVTYTVCIVKHMLSPVIAIPEKKPVCEFEK